MVAPASCYPKRYVDSAIDNQSVIYGKELAEPRGRYPLVKSVIVFTLEEYVESMVNSTSFLNKDMRISARTI